MCSLLLEFSKFLYCLAAKFTELIASNIIASLSIGQSACMNCVKNLNV